MALAELRGLRAGFRLLVGEVGTVHDQPQTVLHVDTSWDRALLQVSATNAKELQRLAVAVRRIHVMGQLERMMVLTLCTLVVWRLELAPVSPSLVGAALLGIGLLAAVLPCLLGARATAASLRAMGVSTTSWGRPLGLGTWALLVCSLLLGVVAFLCLTPLLANVQS